MALTAALLGWMFDGLEMGLFPLVARPALQNLGIEGSKIGLWISVATAGFLVGAATGGVLFGWLGDRIGRVRAMTLSVLTYAVFSGLCGIAQSAEQIAALRFISALGMGGEWSLGVALVMEIWPDRSRGFLAGLIGAAANFGYLLIGLVGLGLNQVLKEAEIALFKMGLPDRWVAALVSHTGWRLLMLLGAAPALLTFFIRLFVPESERWQHEHGKGTTTNWATRDLLGVGIGALAALGMIYLWAVEIPPAVRLPASAVALVVITLGYIYPVTRYLLRSGGTTDLSTALPIIGRMLVGACLSGVALLGTWAAVQWAPAWADELGERPSMLKAVAGNIGLGSTGTAAWIPLGDPKPFVTKNADAKAYTQICMASGAIIGTFVAAIVGNWLGRRITYVLLCLTSLVSALVFFRMNDHYGPMFLITVFLAGGFSATFYGWLPLYLPELFHTRVRATGQGFSFNFGRIIAAVGALQTGNLMGLIGGGFPWACSVMSLVYLVGIAIIWLAPETHGQPLPE